MALLAMPGYSANVGLLNEEDRKKAAQLGWLNAAANLFDASAPQVGGIQKTPFQMLGTGLRGYAQGAQSSMDRSLQENELLKKKQDEQKLKDWASGMYGKLGQYGISSDAAAGMSPEQIAKMIIDSEENNRKYIQQEKLYGMLADRQAATQEAIAARQSALQQNLFDRQREAEDFKYKRDMDLLNRKLEAQGLTQDEGGNVYSTKPLPQGIAKIQDESLGDLGLASGLKNDLESFSKKIDEGNLDFGVFSNMKNWSKNKIGLSDQESRNYASFGNALEKLRNDSLRLNKGVQTEGDSQRAWNELINNKNDKDIVKQRLKEIMAINERAVELKKLQIDQLRTEYKKPPMDYSKYENIPSAYEDPSGISISGSAPSEGGIQFLGFK